MPLSQAANKSQVIHFVNNDSGTVNALLLSICRWDDYAYYNRMCMERICSLRNTRLSPLHYDDYNTWIITATSQWVGWHLKSPASRLLIQAQIKEKSQSPVNSPDNTPVMREMFPFDDVIMIHLKAGLLKTSYVRYTCSSVTQITKLKLPP